MIEYLNFGQMFLEPPENGNQKVPLLKGGSYPQVDPPSEFKKNIPKINLFV